MITMGDLINGNESVINNVPILKGALSYTS